MAVRRTASQDRGRETQERVLHGAAEVFGRAGYGVASLRLISEASGVPMGTINFHFGSKDQIALAIIQEQHNRAIALAEQVESRFDTAIERLIHLAYEVAVQLQEDRIVQAGIELSMQVGDFIVPTVDSYDGWSAAIARQLAQGLENGELVSELDAAALAETYLACFTGVQILSRVRTDRADLLAAVRKLWLVIAGGLVAPDRRDFTRQTLDAVFGTDGA